MRNVVCGLLLVLFAISPVSALQTAPIGHIQTTLGTASIIRETESIPAKPGAAIYRGDLVRTAKPGAVGIVLTDDTTISLGPNSELSLRDYTFAPKEGKFSLVARMMKGTFVYLSGLIGKLAPDAVQLIIPDATISVRGTKLLIEVQE